MVPHWAALPPTLLGSAGASDFDAAIPWLVIAAALAIAVVGAPLFLRLRGGCLVGPLAALDLLRRGRSGWALWLRTGYVVALAGGLLLAFLRHLPGPLFLANLLAPQALPANLLAGLGRAFVFNVLWVQALAVLLLTPAWVAGAIASEKEANTLDLLLITPLADREIVLGKLFGRLGQVGVVLLAGLPVLTLALVLGGVHPAVPLAGFVVTAATLFSVGSFALLCSVLARSTFTALVCSYGLVVVFNLGCLCLPIAFGSSPLAFLLELDSRSSGGPPPAEAGGLQGWTPPDRGPWDVWEQAGWMTLTHVVLHGVLALYFLVWAVRVLRVPADQTEPAASDGLWRLAVILSPPGPAAVSADVAANSPPIQRPRPHPPVGDRPLLWKELYVGAGSLADPPPGLLWRAFLGAPAIVCLALFGLVEFGHRTVPKDMVDLERYLFNPLLRLAVVGLWLAWSVATLFRAADSVCHEREDATLDGLLSLPVERRRVLAVKWVGSILRFRRLGYFLAGAGIVGFITGGLHPLAVVLLLVSGAAWVCLLASLGLVLSTVCRTSRWARLGAAVVVLVLLAGPLLVRVQPRHPDVLLPGTENLPAILLVEDGLNPLRDWWVAAFSLQQRTEGSPQQQAQLKTRLAAIAEGAAVAAGAAALLWWLAWWRFRRL
jgi:ABC-type transport system involved in multi-copper enzyme maturation permease subunit